MFPLRKVEDFNPVFDMYPRAHDIALASDSLQDAAHKIAKYIDQGSRVSAYLHTGIAKTEADPVEEPKEVKLKVGSVDAFALSIGMWAEKRKEESRSSPRRDTTFTPDPGRLRPKELDESPPVTLMDKIKQKIKDLKE